MLEAEAHLWRLEQSRICIFHSLGETSTGVSFSLFSFCLAIVFSIKENFTESEIF